MGTHIHNLITVLKRRFMYEKKKNNPSILRNFTTRHFPIKKQRVVPHYLHIGQFDFSIQVKILYNLR